MLGDLLVEIVGKVVLVAGSALLSCWSAGNTSSQSNRSSLDVVRGSSGSSSDFLSLSPTDITANGEDDDTNSNKDTTSGSEGSCSNVEVTDLEQRLVVPSFGNKDTVTLEVFDSTDAISTLWAKAVLKSWEVGTVAFWLVQLFTAGEDTEVLVWIFIASLDALGLSRILFASLVDYFFFFFCFLALLSSWMLVTGALQLFWILCASFDALILSWIFCASLNNWRNIFNQFWIIANIWWIQYSLVTKSNFSLDLSKYHEFTRF